MILQLIENLEKLMFVNYGHFCASADNFNAAVTDKNLADDLLEILGTKSKDSENKLAEEIDVMRQFFKQNEKVCLGWFRNIRKACVRVSLHCGKPASALYHCNRYFEDFSDKINFTLQLDKFRDWHLILLMNVEGLLQLECPDEIESLRDYALNRDANPETDPINMASHLNSNPKYDWMNGAIMQAKGYFESAIAIYQHQINVIKSTDIKNFDRKLQVHFITQLQGGPR